MNFFDKDFALAKLFFSLFPTYNLHKDDRASTWLGWYVCLLTNRVKAIPFLGTIVNLIEKCLASSFGFNKKAEARDVVPVQEDFVKLPPIKVVDLVQSPHIKVVNPDLFAEKIEKKIDEGALEFEEEIAPPQNANAVVDVKDGLENHQGVIDANHYLPEDLDEEEIMRVINQQISSPKPNREDNIRDALKLPIADGTVLDVNNLPLDWRDEEEVIRAINQEEQKDSPPHSPKSKEENPKGVVDQNDFLPEWLAEDELIQAIDQGEKKQNLPEILPENIDLQRKEGVKLFGDADDISPSADLAGNVKTLQEATCTILTTSGLTIFEKEERQFCDFRNKNLWMMTAVVTKAFPEAISPAALKEFRELNLNQYIALKLKRLSHVLSLKGTVPLPSGNEMKLQGFYEIFVIPMLVSAYAEFAKNSTLFTWEENREICSKFNHFCLSNFMTPKEIESMVAAMHDPKIFGPYLLGTGFDEHSAALLFAGNYALFCDQSGISTEPGISVFYIPNRELITESFINEFSERADIKEKDYKVAKKFKTALGATLIHHEPLPAQIAGNCTYTSMQTAHFALKAIAFVMKFFQGI